MIPFGKKPKTLPTVLGPDEVQSLLACSHRLIYRTILTVLYAAGLRLSEGLHLQVPDIDSRRMLLRVACGKGAKERLVPLSPRLLEALRDYWQQERPRMWLFPGHQSQDRPLNPSGVQKACSRAAQLAKLNKRVTPHTLRHSYATGLLEAGVDLLTIGRLLGHGSFSSTLIYLHVRRPHLQSAPSPLDWLPVHPCPEGGQAEPTTKPSSAPSCPKPEQKQPRGTNEPSQPSPTAQEANQVNPKRPAADTGEATKGKASKCSSGRRRPR